MQRLLTLVFLLCLAIPAGVSISGCTRNPAGNYCNGLGYGPKLTDVASIDLEPRTTGISLSFGQTLQVQSPSAKNCKGTTASVASYTYGTTNNQLVDISPTGNLCAGTWNRRSGGGIPDYTICNPPSPLPSTQGLPYSSAFITATGNAVTSNQVTVYVHAQATSLSLILESLGTTNPISGCLSQTQTAQLDTQACYSNGGTQTEFCAPATLPTSSYACAVPTGAVVPSCSVALGNLGYATQSAAIATIDQYGVITAQQPGTTYITASVGQSASSAGYFSTCPPASISITLNGNTSGTVTQGATQNLVTTAVDTKGNTLTGLTLDYQSTNPLDISAGSNGAITANFAGQASIYAVCQPTTCNPSPINKIGANGTGLPVTSNPVSITTPGIASSFLWMANPQSQYFVPVQLISGTVGSAVKMPYVPNSMVLDRTATSLYFGSSRELMIYNAVSNSLTKEDLNVPGIVLAASPDNQTVLINDPIRKVFYLYKPASAAYTTQSGIGYSAQWTPDAKTLYIVGEDPNGVPTLFVYNINTNWTTYKLATPSSNLSVAIPGVGAFLAGSQTVAHSWCPDLTSSSAYPAGQAYPEAAFSAAATDVLTATPDGQHILGANINPGTTTATLSDIFPLNFASLVDGACPAKTQLVTLPYTQVPLPVQASAINSVVASPTSSLAFILYNAASGATATPALLPYYQPGAVGTQGNSGTVTLSGSPTAPIAGVFSLDDTQFFVSTTGDNAVHYIDVKTLKDTKQITPGLVDGNGNVVPATFIVVKPRATT